MKKEEFMHTNVLNPRIVSRETVQKTSFSYVSFLHSISMLLVFCEISKTAKNGQ